MKVTCEACPLQIEGTIDGVSFYFRARGESWSIRIGGNDPVDAPQWHKCERWGDGRYADSDHSPQAVARNVSVLYVFPRSALDSLTPGTDDPAPFFIHRTADAAI